MGELGFPREDVPFLPLLAGLAAWSLYRLAVDQIVKWWSPDFYHKLRGNYEKYLFFFGMLLGLVRHEPVDETPGSSIGCTWCPCPCPCPSRGTKDASWNGGTAPASSTYAAA